MADSAPQPPSPSIFARIRAAPVTAALVAANVAAFLWAQQHGSTSDPGTLLRFGALEPLHVWAGEYWRLVTCMFMHGGWVHIAVNMYMATGWATALERALGAKRFALVYFLSGLAGSCASVISGWIFGTHLSVGASGALFGVVGAVLALRRRQLGSFEAFFADRGIRSLLVQIGILTAIGLTLLHLDNAAHIGGLVTGFVATWLLVSRAPRSVWLAFAAACGALFIFAARPWWTPTGVEADKLVLLSRAYLSGQEPDGERWPVDVARGERFLDKGCTHGIAAACDALADHVVETGGPDAPARSSALRRRSCDLDPGRCASHE
jgi:rhomboid protease GluP